MTKFWVRIFGEVPAELVVEADDKEDAVDKAFQRVLDELTFEAEPEDGEPCPSA